MKSGKVLLVVSVLLFRVLLPISADTSRERAELYFDHYSKRNNLSSDIVYSLMRDEKGFAWFATGNGLCRFDGSTFKCYSHVPEDPGSLSNNRVRYIIPDVSDPDIIWAATQMGGLNRMNAVTGTFTVYRHDENNPDSLIDDNVLILCQDDDGIIWIGTEQKGLSRFDPATGIFTYIYGQTPDGAPEGLINDILVDDSGLVWIASNDLTVYDPELKTFSKYEVTAGSYKRGLYQDSGGVLWITTANDGLFYLEEKTASFVSVPTPLNRLYGITEDSGGNLWIASHNEGLLKYNIAERKAEIFAAIPDNPNSLVSNRLRGVYYDRREDMLWVLSYRNGVDSVNLSQYDFGHLKRPGVDEAENQVKPLLCASDGSIWYGGPAAVLTRYLPETESYRSWNMKYSASSSIEVIYEDSEGAVWIGGWRLGLNRWDPASDTITRYTSDKKNPYSLSVDHVYSICEDHTGDLWIGVAYGDLNRFDRSTGRFYHYTHDESDIHSISDVEIISIFEDSKKRLWLGTFSKGLNLYDRDNDSFIRFQNDPDDFSSISSGSVYDFYEAPDGTVWISTAGGLDRFHEDDGSFLHFEGLPDILVMGLAGGDDGGLWVVVSEKGLSRIDLVSGSVASFFNTHGLSSTKYYDISKARGGLLYVSGTNGINYFNPSELSVNGYRPEVALTDFQIFNESVVPGEAGSVLSHPALTADEITLSYKDSVFTFEANVLSMRSPSDNRLRYMMRGFDESWHEVPMDRRFITYTNLNPGSYRFAVKGANNDGVWGAEHSLQINIKPPLWRTWWAYLLYVVSLSAAVVMIIRVRTNIHIKELQREKRLGRLKDEFLANTSHELRTPLNGMIGIAENILMREDIAENRRVRDNLELIVRSGKRLSALVDDVLDYSKLKNNEISLNRHLVDIRVVVDVILPVITPLLQNKPISVEVRIPEGLPLVTADENRVQQILFNLLGNAVKFTQRGIISIGADQDPRYPGFVTVSVADTGIGIAKEHFDSIFSSFEQLAESSTREHGGTGLGLAISRRLVELQGGLLWVNSVPGEGSVFSFTLPAAEEDGREPSGGNAEDSSAMLKKIEAEGTPGAIELEDRSRPDAEATVLVVDDEAINQLIVKNFLENERYNILLSGSGGEALEIIAANPDIDLVVLDIMMPRMSGYDVCRRLRTEYSLSDLPVLMLTARNQVNDLVQGFEAGANDFLSKPFEKDELLARVRSLISLKLSQKQLGYFRQLLKNIIDSMPSIVIGVDGAGVVTQWNNKAAAETGIEVDKAVGEKIHVLLPQLQDELENIIGAIHNSDNYRRNNIGYKTETGVLYSDLIVYPLTAGSSRGAVIRIDDVTKRVALESIVVQSEKMKLIGQMSSGIVHEIKNPVSGIIMSINNLLSRFESGHPKNVNAAEEAGITMAEIEKYLEKRSIQRIITQSRDAAQRTIEIIESMLSFSRRSSLSIRKVNILDLLDSTIQLCLYDNSGKVNFHRINISREINVDEPFLYCDSNSLQQVLLNILRNGAQAMTEKKHGIINSKAEEDLGYQPQFIITLSENDTQVIIEISDNGPGMNEKIKEQIFEPFFTTKEAGEGTGLGLSVSHYIINEIHKGSLKVESTPGEGTSFIIELPRMVEEEEAL